MKLSKSTIITALGVWINQRPGLEFGNYGEISSYRAEQRSIARDRKDAVQLLRAVSWRDSITAEQLIAAFPRAFSGRLTISEGTNKAGEPCAVLDYCTGQYWPTEYRKAAAAVLASALWDNARSNMPKPDGKITKRSGVGVFSHESEHDNINGKTPGDWLRDHFKREFGRTIQQRWFD